MPFIGHIHLDETGLAHDADDGPTYRWGVVSRVEEPIIQATIHRSPSGHTYFAKAVDSNLDQVQHTDWTYQVRVTQSELNYLKSLIGKECELIDNVHVADGTDHLAYIQNVAVSEVTSIENIGQYPQKYNATVKLVDLESPA